MSKGPASVLRIVVAAALLTAAPALVAPRGGAVGNTTITFGASSFDVPGPHDKDLAAIAGLSGTHTRWFLGQSLYFAPSPPGQVFVYAAYRDLLIAPWNLAAVGSLAQSYTFTDPNGVTWTSAARDYDYDGDGHFSHGETIFRVPAGPLTDDPTAGAYNFVMLVDTKSSADFDVFPEIHGGAP